MTTHLHEALKIVAVPLYNILNRQIKIFRWNFNIKLSKINRMDRKVGLEDLKTTVNQFNIIKTYTISHNSRIQILFKFP